ncbi:DUF6443 domain-containing protein [Ornithobacterium rhinotracheale]|uniref:DUF6443 domain-containing protein n=1 Tax=Ornithobacterium rhinotracheale TaxID=28251 RepID=UPI004035CB96
MLSHIYTKRTYKNFLILLFACFFILSKGQILPKDRNYIHSKEYLTPTKSSTNSAKQINGVTYFDGLGREQQVVKINFSPEGKDVITHIEYDELGRQAKDFLPSPTNQSNGAFNQDWKENYDQYYSQNYNTTIYFSEKEFEKSPISRILKQAAPGEDWKMGANHEVKFKYQTNTDNEVMYFFAHTEWDQVNEVYQTNLTKGKEGNLYYPAGSLVKTITLNENNINEEKTNSVEEFKNLEGNLILNRTYNDKQEKIDTYYVYDIYGNLSYIITPSAADKNNISTEILDNLCFQYRYDYKNRLIEKRIPGKDWEFFLYDQQDRLVASQDGNMRKNNYWIFTKYDMFNRVSYSGILKENKGRAAFQKEINDLFSDNNVSRSETPFTMNGISISYQKNKGFPSNPSEIFLVNYYDDYLFSQAIPPKSEIENQYTINEKPEEKNNHVTTKSLITASFNRVLGENAWEKNYYYYDKNANIINTYSENAYGGFTDISKKLDFRGKVIYEKIRHKRELKDNETILVNKFFYDDQERIIKQTQKINELPEELLFKNKYDELGVLTTKQVGGDDLSGENAIQSFDYSYNIRGWLTKIKNTPKSNNSLFTLNLSYNSDNGDLKTPIKPLYNGNISKQEWKFEGSSINAYNYYYDALNRLMNAKFFEQGTATRKFQEKLKYDNNNNITAIKRWNQNANDDENSSIDDLTFHFNKNSNQINYISDLSNNQEGAKPQSQNNYSYDANGNITKDVSKNIKNILYNYLNLPQTINLADFDVNYVYLSNGTKISKRIKDTLIDYLHNFQYKNKELQFIPNSEGYFDFKNQRYVYILRDHLGNNRLSFFKDKISGEINIIDTHNYYPFGLAHSNSSEQKTQNKDFKYKFNGKELQPETGLYDYGARFYLPDIGRWMNIDPLAEKYYSISPYAYVNNNPIMLIDPTGMMPEDIFVNDSKGNHLFTLDDGKSTITTITVSDLYDLGIQWWEPEANNYMPLKGVNPILTSLDYSGVLHTSFKDIVEWTTRENRFMASFASGLRGDWKKASDGGRGYILAEADGLPYWTDALGQIPFTIDTYEYYLRNYYGNKSIENAGYRFNVAVSTIKDGINAANGIPYISPDRTKSYDNFMILRTVSWAEKHMHQYGKSMNSWNEHVRGIYLYSSELSVPLTNSQYSRFKNLIFN